MLEAVSFLAHDATDVFLESVLSWKEYTQLPMDCKEDLLQYFLYKERGDWADVVGDEPDAGETQEEADARWKEEQTAEDGGWLIEKKVQTKPAEWIFARAVDFMTAAFEGDRDGGEEEARVIYEQGSN